jgi:hypothetical protein
MERKNELLLIGIGELGLLRLDRIIELDYNYCNYAAVDYLEENLIKSLSKEKILIKTGEVNSLNSETQKKIEKLLIRNREIIIIFDLGDEISNQLACEILEISRKTANITTGIVSYPFKYTNKENLDVAKKYESIIIDKVDIPILLYGDSFIKRKHINKESDIKDINDQVVKKFIKAYSFFRESTMKKREKTLVDISWIVESDIRRKVAIKILTNYTYYEQYIPKDLTESFIEFISSYLLGETEDFYFNSEIFVYLLDGYSFYHERFEGSLSDIRKFLYELSNEFLECLDK